MDSKTICIHKPSLPFGYRYLPQREYVPTRRKDMEPLAVPEVITFHSVARTDIPGVPTHGLNKVVDDSATPLQNLEGTGITLCFLMAGYPGDLPTVRIANVQKLTRQELFDRASAILSRWCLLARNLPDVPADCNLFLCGYQNLRIVSLYRRYQTYTYQIELICGPSRVCY